VWRDERVTFVEVAILWGAVSMVVSPFIGGWLARRPAGLTPAGLGTMGDRGTAAPLDP
jgi:hypothetical protein